MLKISAARQAESVVLKLEGRLAGAWVLEADRAWRRVRGAGSVVVDLSEVTYVDSTGRHLLVMLHRRGCRLLATTCLIKAIVDEIADGPETVCPRPREGHP